MATKKKLLQAAAGSAGGAGLNVEEVFSTYLYEGNASTQTITNGIDLSGEGGLVWVKNRTYAYDHYLYDTERGATKYLSTNDTGAEATNSNSLTSFNSNGFTLGLEGDLNGGGHDVASWTFRKAPKFFDVVTYTGNGTAGRTISHNLGCDVGVIIVKAVSGTYSGSAWTIYHKDLTATDILEFDTGATKSRLYSWNNTEPTDSVFTVGSGSETNGASTTYVAYLFAHNDGDGDFGPDGDADIIKCGSYTHSGSAWTEDLGFEPQFVISKNITSIGSWQIVDNMRGLLADNGSGTAYARLLKAEVSNAENNGSGINITSTGLEGDGTGGGGSGTYIYIAIRRGPMAVPESATDVFDIDTHDSTEPLYDTSFPVDFGMYRRPDIVQGMYLGSRMQGAKELRPNATSKEDNNPYHLWDYQNGWGATGAGGSGSYSWMWRRAPSFMDVVAYTGNGSAGRTVSHNLGVAPEMMWVKRRDAARQWGVYHKDIGNTKAIYLNDTGTPVTTSTFWNDTTPTESVFTVGTNNTTNASGGTYIAYLFASLDGVSKVGSYTGNGSTQTIDCGFSAGARFVLLKRTDAAENWWLFDTERGISTANTDGVLSINNTNAEFTENTAFAANVIQPNSTGFQVLDYLSASGKSYIFYAIA